MASIISCPPPVADFTGRVDLHANGNIVGVYRDEEGAEYLRVAPAANVDFAAARWFRIVPEPEPEPAEPEPATDSSSPASFEDEIPPFIVPEPAIHCGQALADIAASGPLVHPDFGDPPEPECIDDPERDAYELRALCECRATVNSHLYERAAGMADELKARVAATISWLYSILSERCQHCGCRRMTEVTVRGFTGVRAPDGTRESGESTATICERCGAVVGEGVA